MTAEFASLGIIHGIMDIVGMIIIAFSLAMDAFAVSLGVGTMGAGFDRRSIFRLAFHFGIFQGLMTLLGWLAGSTISEWISEIDHWIAFILLVLVGLNMIRSSALEEAETYRKDPTRGGTMIFLSLATSIDALAVGVSLAFIDTNIFQAVSIIGVIAFGLSLAGLIFGSRLGQQFGKRMEVIGGLILIGIGIRILILHLA